MQFGPEALLVLRKDIALAIASASVVFKNIVLLLSFVKCLFECDMLFL